MISCLSFNKLSKCLEESLGIQDTCGVFSLHFLPGLLGGLLSSIVVLRAGSTTFGDNIETIIPARIYRKVGAQFGVQIGALFTTIGISIVSGLLTGLIIKMGCFNAPTDEECFDDSEFFAMEESEKPEAKKG